MVASQLAVIKLYRDEIDIKISSLKGQKNERNSSTRPY
jgi:hypothetical protein